MSKKEERLKRLSELFDLIPEDKQEGILLGTQMVATLYSTGERRPA